MSVKATTYVWDNSPSTGTQRLVLLAIADHASRDGTNAWPSIQTIAEMARCSRRQAKRCIDALEQAGEIVVELHAGGDKDCREDRRPNRYTVVLSDSRGDTGDTPRDERGDIEGADGVTSEPPRGDKAMSPKQPLTQPQTKTLSDATATDVEVPDTARTLTRRLAVAVQANGFKVPQRGTKANREWLTAMDRLLRIDKADPAQVEQVIGWATADSFWRANIRSATKFREQYPTLRLRWMEKSGDGNGGHAWNDPLAPTRYDADGNALGVM